MLTSHGLRGKQFYCIHPHAATKTIIRSIHAGQICPLSLLSLLTGVRKEIESFCPRASNWPPLSLLAVFLRGEFSFLAECRRRERERERERERLMDCLYGDTGDIAYTLSLSRCRQKLHSNPGDISPRVVVPHSHNNGWQEKGGKSIPPNKEDEGRETEKRGGPPSS